MSNTVIKVEQLYKQYRLGVVGTGTLSHDLNRWWYKVTGREDPYLKVTEQNNREEQSDSTYVWALQDVNFSVEKGEVLGIIGKNGAGKSTLLKILSKVTTPTKGAVKVKGRIASLLEVGTGFNPDLTGRENIFLNGAILGMNRNEIKSKFDEIVAFSGVEKYIDTPVKRYSSGMYVRLAFAVAAHLEPEILIVDEVLAVGDAEFQKKCLGKMKDISGQGRTVLFVSHNMAAVKSLCSRAIMLQNGVVTKSGQTDDVISFYLKESEGYNLENYRVFANEEVGIPGLSINSIGIKAKNKDYSETVSRDDEMELIVDYTLSNQQRSRLDFNFRFKDSNNHYIFATSSGLFKEEILKAGKHSVTIEIPAFFFNPNIFYIDFMIVENKARVLYLGNDFLSISVNPQKVEMGEWMGKSLVPITPFFKWT